MELKRIGRVLPGSLSELKTHLEKLLELYTNERNNFTKSPIYLWFLIEKANVVFSYFNHKIDDKSEEIEYISNLEFEAIIQTQLLNTKEKEGIGQWKNFILEKIKMDA
jgi:hypothetical protein